MKFLEKIEEENKMTKEQILQKLEGKYEIVREETKSTGVLLRLNNGTIVNCYNNGNHNLQGKSYQRNLVLPFGYAGRI